jgi:hypothetical protein
VSDYQHCCLESDWLLSIKPAQAGYVLRLMPKGLGEWEFAQPNSFPGGQQGKSGQADCLPFTKRSEGLAWCQFLATTGRGQECKTSRGHLFLYAKASGKMQDLRPISSGSWLVDFDDLIVFQPGLPDAGGIPAISRREWHQDPS